MKKVILLFAVILMGCGSAVKCTDTVTYAEDEYEKIIQRDSVICEDVISGKISMFSARMLLRGQRGNCVVLRYTLDELAK